MQQEDQQYFEPQQEDISPLLNPKKGFKEVLIDDEDGNIRQTSGKDYRIDDSSVKGKISKHQSGFDVRDSAIKSDVGNKGFEIDDRLIQLRLEDEQEINDSSLDSDEEENKRQTKQSN